MKKYALPLIISAFGVLGMIIMGTLIVTDIVPSKSIIGIILIIVAAVQLITVSVLLLLLNKLYKTNSKENKGKILKLIYIFGFISLNRWFLWRLKDLKKEIE